MNCKAVSIPAFHPEAVDRILMSFLIPPVVFFIPRVSFVAFSLASFWNFVVSVVVAEDVVTERKPRSLI